MTTEEMFYQIFKSMLFSIAFKTAIDIDGMKTALVSLVNSWRLYREYDICPEDKMAKTFDECVKYVEAIQTELTDK